jgi:hypothetical protein
LNETERKKSTGSYREKIEDFGCNRYWFRKTMFPCVKTDLMYYLMEDGLHVKKFKETIYK